MTGAPFDLLLAALVRHLRPLGGVTAWDCEVVVAHLDGTVDLKPAAVELGAGLQAVPVALQGACAVQLNVGARVKLEFLDGDRGKPVVTQVISGTFAKVTIAGPVIEIGDTGAAITLAGSAQPVVRVGDTLAAGLTCPSGPVSGKLAIAPPVSTVKA